MSAPECPFVGQVWEVTLDDGDFIPNQHTTIVSVVESDRCLCHSDWEHVDEFSGSDRPISCQNKVYYTMPLIQHRFTDERYGSNKVTTKLVTFSEFPPPNGIFIR